MNNFKSRVKLFSGVLLVTLLCIGLAVYLDKQSATVGSSSAQLQTESYAVGSEYDGLITREYVMVGDHVTKGQTLFELSSDSLKVQLSAGGIKKTDLNYKLTSDGSLIFTATRAGTVDDLKFSEGSFIKAGDVVATVSDTAKAVIRAEFYLSGPQYAKFSPQTPVMITLAGDKKKTGKITSIDQRSRSGKTVTIVEVAIDKLDDSQTVYVNSSPVSMELILNSNTYFDWIKRTTKSYTE